VPVVDLHAAEAAVAARVKGAEGRSRLPLDRSGGGISVPGNARGGSDKFYVIGFIVTDARTLEVSSVSFVLRKVVQTEDLSMQYGSGKGDRV